MKFSLIPKKRFYLCIFLTGIMAVSFYWAFDNTKKKTEYQEKSSHTYYKNEYIDSIGDSQQTWEKLTRNSFSKNKLSIQNINLYSKGDPISTVENLWENGFVPPGRDLPPWPLELPIDWNADPYQDPNWRFHLHAWRMVDPMLKAWKLSGEIKYLEDALLLVTDWYEYHFIHNKTSAFQWYDMSTGLRASKLAYIIDRILREKIALKPAEKAMLIHLAHSHVLNLRDPKQLSTGNHGLFQMHGLMALCSVVPEIESCNDYNSYVERELQELLLNQFSREGVHLENSPQYHFFAYHTVERMMRSGWYEDFSFVKDLLQKVAQNRVWMVHPDGKLVTVGDSEPSKRRISWPIGAPECHQILGADDNCYLLKIFPETGYAIVRSDWAVPADRASMLFFMASFQSQVHKLPDDLSFEWYDRGKRILMNAGKYAYKKDNWREYVFQTRAHNTVEIDGENYSVRRKDAYGSALNKIYKNSSIFYLSGEVFHKNLATNHRRILLFNPNRWLAIIDSLSSDKTRSYTQWFHFASDIDVHTTDGTIIGKYNDNFHIVVEHYPFTNERLLISGQKEPYIQGWVTKRYGEMEPRSALGFTHSAKNIDMVTIFGFSVKEIENAKKSIRPLLSNKFFASAE